MTIKIYTDIQQMSGSGEEWLVTEGAEPEIIAKFRNGTFNEEIAKILNPGVEVTKTATAA